MKRCYSCFHTYEDEFDICPHCGSVEVNKPKEPIQLAPGMMLADRYIIGLAVGSGGFGIVYRAWDTKLETIVAVKEFFVSRIMTRAEGVKNVIVNKKSMGEYEYRKERFLAEARNMAKFGSHKSIPNVFEFFEENNTAYIVMELLEGESLSEYLANNKNKLDIDFALFVTTEVGNALKSLHESGIIHRDVAPDNIYICSGREIRIKLMDLGAAKLADSSDDVIDIILKPGYSPAEQYDNSKNIGPWTDVYALGATLYAMVTGVKPDESTNRVINDTVVPPNEINPNVSENLSNTIMKAIAVERHMRFKSVEEFLKALSGEKKVLPLSVEKRRKRVRRIMGIAVASLLVLVIAGVVWNGLQTKREQEDLNPAKLYVWFSVQEGSNEEEAMKSVISDFEEKFPNVEIEYRAIAENEYVDEIKKAIQNNTLPHLFESTQLTDDLLKKANNVSPILNSTQAKECLFLNQYKKYYSDTKRIPLGIEVPVAYVITSGNTQIEYKGEYFKEVSDFGAGTVISADKRYSDLLSANYDISGLSGADAFFAESGNTSPVLLSSSMAINDVRTLKYEKKYVYSSASQIYCRFTYEWSLGDGSEDEERAAERLLSWMLGNVYQRMLMVNSGGRNQVPEIPVNEECFKMKAQVLKNLEPIVSMYKRFKFVR